MTISNYAIIIEIAIFAEWGNKYSLGFPQTMMVIIRKSLRCIGDLDQYQGQIIAS
jgi:hypothetical protein